MVFLSRIFKPIKMLLTGLDRLLVFFATPFGVRATDTRKQLAILINGKVVIAPLVNSTLDDKIEISGKLTKEEVEMIVKSLNAK